MMTPIMTTLATAPHWHTVAEIAAALNALPIRVQNSLGALTVARLVEWDDAGRVALKGGWFVRDRFGGGGPYHIRNAEALARVLGGTICRVNASAERR